MKLYVGGAWQGKCDYVSGKFQNKPTIVQGDRCTKEDMKNADIINHFHEYVFRMAMAWTILRNGYMKLIHQSALYVMKLGVELSRLIKICVITGNL